eukprot:TRINITY_DN8972_c0_g1_i1.p1 TRINITY_DN8972_c0_g1~~TRINITY_DN8972_c0_g1_i1.p1  ORF type:complete len:495 (-),score=133.49 TRINITY_DN8972_c0_g1_i1:100-1584(-)
MSTDAFAGNMLGGFEILYRRTEEVLKSTREIAEWFKKLSQVEEAYAKSMLKLNAQAKKTFGGSKASKTSVEKGTLNTAWGAIHSEIESVGNKHAGFGLQVVNEISQSMLAYVKDKEGVRKKLVLEGTKLTKEYNDQVAALKKAKGSYYSKSKDADHAQAAHEKAKADGSMKPKELSKLRSRASKCLDNATSADKEYKKVLKKTNEHQTRFYEKDMPKTLTDFQAFEEDRIKFIKQMFEKHADMRAEFPAFVTASVETLKSSSLAIETLADIDVYVQEARTCQGVPPCIEYTAYSSDNPNFGTLPAASTPAAAGPAVVGSRIASPGGMGTSGFSSSSSRASLPTTFGLTAADQSLSIEEKTKKLNDQVETIDSNLKAETKSRKGLEKLVKFYASDPVAQEKANGELEDQKKKIAEMKENRRTVKQQLAELTGAPISPRSPRDDDYYGGASTENYGGGGRRGGGASRRTGGGRGVRLVGMWLGEGLGRACGSIEGV